MILSMDLIEIPSGILCDTWRPGSTWTAVALLQSLAGGGEMLIYNQQEGDKKKKSNNQPQIDCWPRSSEG